MHDRPAGRQCVSGVELLFKIFLQKFLQPLSSSKRLGDERVNTQHCTACKADVPLEQFEQYPSGKRRKICEPCRMKHKSRRRHMVMDGSPEAYLRQLVSKLKHTRKKTHDWMLTPEEVFELWDEQNGRCAVSGVTLTHHLDGSGAKEFNASIDRINNEEGYSKINVRLVAYRINIMRHTLSTDMFWWWVKTVHDYSCE
ncbi:MAG: hypothetical protein CMF19_03955 [Idiomarinaceae bacterium]|nr:hypothetical protein [Idiomarinaceae bacterium]